MPAPVRAWRSHNVVGLTSRDERADERFVPEAFMRGRTILLLVLLAACGRWETPWLMIGTVSLKGQWTTMSLPLDGAVIQRSDAEVLQVDVPARTQTERMQVARRFEGALVGNGWTAREQAGDLASSAYRRTNYATPDGGRALVEVREIRGAARVTIRRIPPS
jgi:hypothetical protein